MAKPARILSFFVATLAIAASSAAMARVDLGVNIGVPAPVYVAPAPVYAPPPPPVYYAPAPVVAAPGVYIGWHGDRYWDGRRYWGREEWYRRHGGWHDHGRDHWHEGWRR
jgi:hypothetical protein